MDHLITQIQQSLSADLLKSRYRNQEHPLAGHCYVASEALFHLTGKKLRPHFIHHEGAPHWFLRDQQGNVIDVTASQFRSPVPYEQSRGKGFLTKEPSARARILMGRVKNT